MKSTGLPHIIRSTRAFLATYDAENAQRSTDLTPKQKASAIGRNLFEAKLESMNALPAVSKFSGPVSIVYGLGKIGYGGKQFFASLSKSPNSDAGQGLVNSANSYCLSGLKTAVLGAAAMVPVVGWVPNALAVGFDVAQAANIAIPSAKTEG